MKRGSNQFSPEKFRSDRHGEDWRKRVERANNPDGSVTEEQRRILAAADDVLVAFLRNLGNARNGQHDQKLDVLNAIKSIRNLPGRRHHSRTDYVGYVSKQLKNDFGDVLRNAETADTAMAAIHSAMLETAQLRRRYRGLPLPFPFVEEYLFAADAGVESKRLFTCPVCLRSSDSTIRRGAVLSSEAISDAEINRFRLSEAESEEWLTKDAIAFAETVDVVAFADASILANVLAPILEALHDPAAYLDRDLRRRHPELVVGSSESQSAEACLDRAMSVLGGLALVPSANAAAFASLPTSARLDLAIRHGVVTPQPVTGIIGPKPGTKHRRPRAKISAIRKDYEAFLLSDDGSRSTKPAQTFAARQAQDRWNAALRAGKVDPDSETAFRDAAKKQILKEIGVL